MINTIKDYLKLIRINHYIKNILVFLPIFFAGEILNISYLKQIVLGFICFSLISSVVYIINDIHDINDDKNHPIKKNRPLASGKISVTNAYIVLVFLIITIVIINLFIMNKSYSFIYLIIYIILNLLYSFSLKTIPIVDVIILSFGFLIRVLYGGVVLNINISNWLFLTILTGALFMSMGKRRNELLKNGSSSRKVLNNYSIDFLNKNMYMFLGITLVSFSLWVLEQNINYFVWCIPIVYMICLRYSFNIEKSSSYGDPVDVILSDKLLIFLSMLFIVVITIILYL